MQAIRTVKVAALWAWILGATGLLDGVSPRIAGAVVDNQFGHQVFARDNGLPSNSVRALLQSNDGCLWIATSAGVARFDGHEFRVLNHNTHREFESDDSRALAEGSDGAIWIGTADGLLHFRNRRIFRFTTNEGLLDNRIFRLCASRNDDLWVGSWNGLHRIHGRTVTTFTNLFEVAATTEAVYGIHEDSRGRLWCVGQGPARRWDERDGQWHVVNVPKGFPNWGRNLAEDREGRVWFSSHPLFWIDERDEWKCLGFDHSLGPRATEAWLWDRAGRLWMGRGKSGLEWYFGDKPQTLDMKGFPEIRFPTCFLEDREGNIWIGTEDFGLHRCQPRPFRAYTREDGLPSDLAYAVRETRDGSLWIGTETGLSRFQRGQFTNYIHSERRRNIVRSLAEDANGNLWIGTLGQGVDCYRDGRFTHYPLPGELPGNKVRALEVGRDGGLWIGTAGGLHFLRNDQITSFTTTNGLPHNEVSALHEDRSGRLWLGTEGGGLAVLDVKPQSSEPTSPRPSPPASQAERENGTTSPIVVSPPPTLNAQLLLTTSNGLPSDRVWALHEGADGILWIGTERGLARVDLTSLRSSRGDEALTNRFQSRSPSSPIDQSLLTSPPTITSFTEAHGLYEEAINEIIEDDFGRLWLASERGIMRVDKRELNAVAAGATNRVNCVVYTESDGLLSHECAGQRSQSAACKTRDGRLCFATNKGVVIIDPRKLDELDTRPPVLIERIVVDGEKIFENLPGFQLPANPPTPAPLPGGELTKGASTKLPSLEGPGVGSRTVRGSIGNRWSSTNIIQLAPGRGRVLEIHFTAPTFKAPEKVRFRYRLNGFDHDWTEAETRRVAYYTSLKPGAYRFEVLAANNHSLWSERPAVFEFTLAPHVWQTSWFWIGSGLALILSGYGAHRLRMRVARRIERLERENALHAERIRIRTRIERDLHDDASARVTQAANLITLGRHDPGKAAEHLEKAVRVVEEIGRTIGQAVWSADLKQDSLAGLANYLADFATEFVTDAGLRCRIEFPTPVPSAQLSAQERQNIFLAAKEALHNAVKHAEASTIYLRMRTADSSLVLEIEDDGKGFDLARDLDSESARQSHGLANMKLRLEEIGGRLELHSESGHGTRIIMSVRLASDSRCV